MKLRDKIVIPLFKLNGLLRILIVAFLFLPFYATGQEDSTQEDEKISPAIELSSIQKSDNTIDLKAGMRAKINGTITKLSGLGVDFFYISDSGDVKIGNKTTDRNGLATINIKADGLPVNAENSMNFKVVFQGNDKIESSEEEVKCKRARLSMNPVQDDSLLSIQIKLVELNENNESPIPEAAVNLYVQRLFSPLKVGEGTTDENGEVIIEIPNDLPGDAQGNLLFLARLEDNEVYGNLETSLSQKWGIVTSDEVKKLPRALWSPQPPMWMLITFIILMTIVWGHYFVIIYELVRLRKEHV